MNRDGRQHLLLEGAQSRVSRSSGLFDIATHSSFRDPRLSASRPRSPTCAQHVRKLLLLIHILCECQMMRFKREMVVVNIPTVHMRSSMERGGAVRKVVPPAATNENTASMLQKEGKQMRRNHQRKICENREHKQIKRLIERENQRKWWRRMKGSGVQKCKKRRRVE